MLGLLAPTAAAQTCVIDRISVDANGVESDGSSNQPVMTPDGRYVVFVSTATNLVPGDTNGVGDVFLRDLQLGTIERVSIGVGGVECDLSCSYPAISPDGRFVAFNTGSTTLDATDTNNALDVYLRDRWNGTIERVSRGVGGTLGDGPSFGATLGGIDARYVLFASWAGNLVPGDTNALRDVFLRDRVADTIERISVSTTGAEGDDSSGSGTLSSFITPDGRFVFFGSSASTLVAGDTNADLDVFVRDRSAGTTEFLIQAPGGGAPNGFTDLYSTTPDGRFVGFTSSAPDLVSGDTNGAVDAFVLDRTTGAVERVSITYTGGESMEGSWAPVVSQDGRYVVFSSAGADFVSFDPNTLREVFRRDRHAGRTERFLQSLNGFPAQADIGSASLSADGSSAAFGYAGDDFAIADLNGVGDIFVTTCAIGQPFCSGDGSSSACPCGVAGAWQGGCPNSAGAGAVLSAEGGAHTQDDTLTLYVRGLPTHTTVLFLCGTTTLNSGAGVPFGDGKRCVGGAIVMLARLLTQVGQSRWGFGVSGAPMLSAQSNVPSGGDFRYYQAWYRNPAPFCTPSTYNLSNGLDILWVP